MAQLIVRGIEEEVVRRLKIRAAEKGHSAEAEHRKILKLTLGPARDDFWSRANRLRRATAGRPRTDSALLLRRSDESPS